ncbi:hypothetical protein DFH09DRAFT_1092505 [Mycena vulgaris]|nr:hypothetical protein DFH09DRAFT_1092505 [Mycena vulgaris]
MYLYSASYNAYTASTPCTGRITTRRAQHFSRLSTAYIIGPWTGGDGEGPGFSSETFPSHAGGLYVARHPKYRLAAPASCATLACHSDGALAGYNLARHPPPLIILSRSPPTSTPSTSLITPPSCSRLSRLSRPVTPARREPENGTEPPPQVNWPDSISKLQLCCALVGLPPAAPAACAWLRRPGIGGLPQMIWIWLSLHSQVPGKVVHLSQTELSLYSGARTPGYLSGNLQKFASISEGEVMEVIARSNGTYPEAKLKPLVLGADSGDHAGIGLLEGGNLNGEKSGVWHYVQFYRRARA